MDRSNDITQLLLELSHGDRTAMDRLMPLVYDELRAVAERQLGGSAEGHTLTTTAMVHEVYIKLVGQSSATWHDRAHFFGVAARAMRQILINFAHRRGAAKRGGGWRRMELDEAVLPIEEQADLVLELDEALGRLASLNERLSRVVELRFFGGMTEAEVAAALGVTERTVRRDWLKARLWLAAELLEESPG